MWSLVLHFALAATPVHGEELTVTAGRWPGRLEDAAASTVELDRLELAAAPAPTVDDALRRVPGFTLFRRAGSRAANPTAQGAALRGLGGSGASRAAVAADGVPLNDPFGGWVYWSRVPRAALERMEIVRGGASDLWGSGALAGVMHLVRREPRPPALAAEAAWGTEDTALAEVYAAGGGATAWSVAASGLRTGGYFGLPSKTRGAVDRPLSARWGGGELALERRADLASASRRLFVRAAGYAEERGNGTRGQVNDTEIGEASGGFDLWRRHGGASLRSWASRQEFEQTFTAVAPDRSRETSTREQRVPAEAAGAVAQGWWQPPGAPRHRLGGALEGRLVEGTSHETVFAGPTSRREAAGGRQRTAAAAVEDLVRLGPRASLQVGLRLDAWENRERSGQAGAAWRRERAWSPRLAAAVALDQRTQVTAAAYRAFRAPTLNELYRPFRVGDVLTLANPDLEAERLAAVEAGLRRRSSSGRLGARATLFWMEVEDAVANLTLAVEPGLTTRRRGNLARTRSRGVEVDLAWRPIPGLEVDAAALLVDAEVLASAGDRDLAGRRVPQVPRRQASLAVAWQPPAARRAPRLLAQARWLGSQFEDDRNRLALASHLALDLRLDLAVGRGLHGYLAVENLLDERAEVGRTPLLTLGPPRQARVGLRFDRR